MNTFLIQKLTVTLLLVTSLGCASWAWAQTTNNTSNSSLTSASNSSTPWPSKSLRLVVTFPAGGSSDASARIVAPKLAERLGQSVVVDNRPGAGGAIGLDLVAKSIPDGYTLVLASAGGLTANPYLYPNLSYNPSTDFAPITLFGTSPFVLIAHPNLPVKNIKELIALAKKEVGKLSYASGGNGTAMHLSGELLKSMTQSYILHVPYRGSAPAMMSVMAGETQLAIADIATIQSQMKSGRIKILGVLSKERSSLAPEIPTLSESGVPGYESNGWFAILAPAQTPPPIVAKLNAEITTVLKQADVLEKFAQAGLEPLTSSPEQLSQYMKSESSKWSAVIKLSGAKVD